MTNKELKELLFKYPDNCIIVYRHNKYSRIDVDFIDFSEETMTSGEKKHFLTLEGNFEED